MTKSLLAAPLSDRVDIIGDVHGEIDALRHLLVRLGVDAVHGRVDRPLVFIGDLIDRGPDSVAVVELVQSLVEAGVAQVVLGNHEMNVLFCDSKEGNGWILGHDDHWWSGPQKIGFPSRVATPEERERIFRFLAAQPLALESSSLRLVHAAWQADAIAKARRCATIAELRATAPPVDPPFSLEGAPTHDALHDPRAPVAYHAGLAEQFLHEQNTRPHKVLTSGLERKIPFGSSPPFRGGQWRMLERDPWWEHDDDSRPVVFGHYWRRRHCTGPVTGKAEVFGDVDAAAWFGMHRQAFCVDFSVGRRYVARHRGDDPTRDQALAALRWPERRLFFDDTEAPIAAR